MRKFHVLYLMKKGNLTEELLKDHIHYLQSLKKSKVLVTCGPLEDGRALLIINSPSKESAIDTIEKDPFIQAGYYIHYEVMEFMEANERNKWLAEL